MIETGTSLDDDRYELKLRGQVEITLAAPTETAAEIWV
jgi:hypothetical protein